MGKKKEKELAFAYANVAVLEGVTKTQFIGRRYVEQVKAKFTYLGDRRLDEATEDWEVIDVLRIMHDEYNCSIHSADTDVARELTKYIPDHRS